MQYSKYLWVFYLWLGTVVCQAQNNNSVNISGTIKDSKGNTIAHASVGLKGTSKGAVSDESGTYHFSAPPGEYILLVSSVGYTSAQYTIDVKGTAYVHNIILQESNTQLDEVVIQGTTQSQELKSSGFTVNAIETKALQNTTKNLNEVLNRSTGIRVRESGGVGSDFNFSINGLSGKSVKFFIDGIPMEVFGSAMSLNNIPVNLAKRVEVYKGVVPVSLGADAMGGAVNIVTNPGISKYIDVAYSVGSFNTHSASVIGQYVHNNTGLTVRASAFANYSDNSYIMRDIEIWDSVASEYVNRDFSRFHDRYRSVLTQLEVGVKDKKWADVLFIGGSYSAYDKQIQTGNNQISVYGQAKRDGDAFNTFLRYRKNDFLLNGLEFNVFASHTLDKYLVTDTAEYRYFWDQSKIKVNKAEMSDEKSLTHIIRPRNYLRANLSYEINEVHSWGINYTLDDVENQAYNELLTDQDYNPGRLKKHILGLAYQQKFFNNKLNNTFFGKYYGLGLSQPRYYSETGEVYTASDAYSDYGYGIATRYLLWKQTGIKVSYEKTYRMQEVNEMFGNGFNQVANPVLKPENSDNYNIGFFTGLKTPDHTLFVEGAAFYRDAKDFIHPILYLSNAQVSQYDNTSKVLIKGLEAEIRYNYEQLISTYINISYQNALNNTKYPVGSNSGTIEATYRNKIPNQPWLFGNAGVMFNKSDFLQTGNSLQLSWDMQYVHWFYLTWEAYGSKQSKSKIPTQFIQNTSITYSMNNGRFNISAECKNLANALAYDNFRLQKPGRFVGLKVRCFFNE